MYVKAVMDYSGDAKPNCVTEVHFLDLNEDILTEIKKAHEKWLRSPDMLDCKNALKHAGGQGGAKPHSEVNFSSYIRNVAGHPGLPYGGAGYLPCEVHYIDEKTLPFGGQQTIFKVANTVMVRIYNGSVIKVSDADALVCNVGTDLKRGKLAEIFETAGGALYTKALNDLKKKPPPLVGDVVIHLETGKLKSKNVLLAIMESRRITTMDGKTAQKLKDMYVKILETASAYGMKRIAFTLLGSGMLVNDAYNLECCCSSLFEGLTNSQVIRGISVEDIQVVNVHPEVTEAIVWVFHKRSSPILARSNFEVIGSNSWGERIPESKKSDMLNNYGQSLRTPWEDKKEERNKEGKKYALMNNPSSSWISLDEDDNYNRGQDEKLHQKETQWNLPKMDDDVSWMGTGNGGKAGNLNIFRVEAGQLKTMNNFKIENSETRQKPVDDAQVKTSREMLFKNTCSSSTSSSGKDTEVIKLEQKLRDLEVKKIGVVKEKRKRELEERIRKAEDLGGLSVPVDLSGKRFPAGTTGGQSNKSTPPLSSSPVEKDREEIELEQKLRELEEKKVIAVKERRKKELKEKIKQLEEDLSVMEAALSAGSEEGEKNCIFCTDVLRNPEKLGCGHEFCSKCIAQVFEYQEACPVCGTKFTENQQRLSSDFPSWHYGSDFVDNS